MKTQSTAGDTAHSTIFWSSSIFALVIVIRAALIGLAPYADEGHYAAAAYFQYLGYAKGLFAVDTVIPAFGPLELYPMLVSWIYFIPLEPYFLLRIADAIIAAFTAVMIYKYLYIVTNRRLSSYLAAILINLAMNHPDFIEAGARNPIPIATLMLFLAMYSLERDSGRKLLLPACCLVASVLFREPFIVLAGVVGFYVLLQHGFRTAFRLFWLGVIFGTAVIALLATLKGGVSGALSILAGYGGVSAVGIPEINLTLLGRIQLAMAQASHIILSLSFLMPALLLGLLSPLFEPSLRTKRAKSLYMLGVAMTLAPLVEVLIKKPYPYHIAQIFIGFGIFASYGFYVFFSFVGRLHSMRPITSRFFVGFVVLIHAVLALDYGQTMRYAAGWSSYFSPVMVFGDWSSPVVKDSYYLQIASIVRQYSSPGDTILSTSYNVYPLTGRIPISREIASLSIYRLMAKNRNIDEEIANLIHEWRPTVFIEEKPVTVPPGGRLGAIDEEVANIYEMTIDVGPGLSPYRRFHAKVHVVPTLR